MKRYYFLLLLLVGLSRVVNAQEVIINEFLASNDACYADEFGEFDDWLEIYNTADCALDINGIYLTDDPEDMLKFHFQPGGEFLIQPGEFFIFWCDNDEEQGPHHTNFKLSGGGEFIGITMTDGTTVADSLTFGEQTTDVSMGRLPDGADSWEFFTTPTPGAANDGSGVTVGTPEDYLLLQAYPNPFNPVTNIRFQLDHPTRISMAVYDLAGRPVPGLRVPAGGGRASGVVETFLDAGIHQVSFYPKALPSGVYFFRLRAENLEASTQLLYLK